MIREGKIYTIDIKLRSDPDRKDLYSMEDL